MLIRLTYHLQLYVFATVDTNMNKYHPPPFAMGQSLLMATTLEIFINPDINRCM